MGKGSSTQTVKQTNEPWGPAQPYIRKILREGGGLYDQGSTFVPADPLQEESFQQREGLARQGNPLVPSVLGNAERVLGGGGMSDRQREVQSALMPYATGQYLGGGNPYLEGILDRTATDTSERIRSEMAGLGRTGSGAHQGILAENLADASNRLRYQDYNQQVQNQMAAAGQVYGMGDTAAQRAAQYSVLAPQMDALRYGDANMLGQVGQERRELGREETLTPWSDLARYAGLITGTAEPYKSSTQVSTIPTDPLSSIAGIGLAAASLFSDERMKQNVKKVGKTDGGHHVYTYEYKDAPGITHMGVMAQEAEKKSPEAVHVYNSMKTVDYSKIR